MKAVTAILFRVFVFVCARPYLYYVVISDDSMLHLLLPGMGTGSAAIY